MRHPLVRPAAAPRLLLPICLALLGACDIPTAAPIVDSRWVVPSQSTTIGVANILPNGVSIAGDSSGFMVSAPATSISRQLSDDCPACAAANGNTVPKPAFIVSSSTTSSLPADIASATLASGTLQVLLTNNYNFDPLRPSATARGFAVITVSNGSTVLGRDSVDGATASLAANGGTLSRSIALSGHVAGTAPLTISFVVNSPSGDPVFMDGSRRVSASFTPSGFKVASASVNVVGRAVTSSTKMDLSSVDSTVTNHVSSGAVVMNVTNPFGITGNLTVRFTSDGGAEIVKSASLASGSSSRTVPFTAAELRTLLGHNVTLSLSGNVSSTTGSVSVSPKDVVRVSTQLDISLEVGGGR